MKVNYVGKVSSPKPLFLQEQKSQSKFFGMKKSQLKLGFGEAVCIKIQCDLHVQMAVIQLAGRITWLTNASTLAYRIIKCCKTSSVSLLGKTHRHNETTPQKEKQRWQFLFRKLWASAVQILVQQWYTPLITFLISLYVWNLS